MNAFLFILFSALSINVPDSVFNPNNALRISPPEWNFPLSEKAESFVKFGYEPVFAVKISPFYIGFEQNHDYENFYSISNTYFFSSPYFSLAHNIQGIVRDGNDVLFTMQDTMDIYFSYGKVIPNITFLPTLIYAKKDSMARLNKQVFGSVSLIYFGTDGIISYVSGMSTDLVKQRVSRKLIKAGIGIMNPRKFVAIGIYSNLVPEFSVRALLPGGAYFDLYYGYGTKTFHISRYLYPEYSLNDSISGIMGKKLNVLLDRAPYSLRIEYEVPDSIYSKNLYVKFEKTGRLLDLAYEYYREFDSTFNFSARPIRKGFIAFHVPLGKKIYVSPELSTVTDSRDGESTYMFSLNLKYTMDRVELFASALNVLRYGQITTASPEDGSNITFFNKRRFQLGTKYSF